MRKIWIAICTLLASCLMFAGCMGGGSTSQSSDAVLSAPASIKMNSKGVLTWDAVDDATAYEVAIGSETTTVETNKQDLLAVITEAGSYTVTVAAKDETKTSETISYSFTAVKLETPSTPVLETDPDTHITKFVWTGGANTRSYLQQINGGKWVSNTTGEYSVSSTGSYVISVKAKGYAAKDILYLDSDASAVSETFEYQQGPVLSLVEMCLINWSVEDGVEFDSYNLWVNGKLAKEGVETTEEGYNLILGDSPAITKTGEYNIQIEAVKNGASYWSNMLEEVGTYNINENEIYSFDNRIAKFPVIKEGYTITNERYHGDSGYSFRFDAEHSEQFNFIRYAASEHANDFSYYKIKKISYWVYVEPIEGYEGMFPASDIPSVKWEKPWTRVNAETKEESKTYIGCQFKATEDIPFGEWVKIELDNVQMAYGNILIMSFAKILPENYVIYVDDICFEELYEDVTVADAEYSVSYSAVSDHMGSWTGYEYTELDFGEENANKTLTVSMDVCGNANPAFGDKGAGIFSVFTPDKDPIYGEYEYIYMDANKFSSLDTWNKVVIQIATNAQGKCYITGMCNRSIDEVEPFNIYFKNIAVVETEEVDGTAMPEGTQKTENANGYYQSFVGLPTELAEGTLVTVKMDIYVTGKYDQYSFIRWVDTVWSVEGGEVNKAPEIANYAQMSENAGQWIHVEFEATVRDFDVLRLNSAYTVMDVSSAGTGVFLMMESFKSAESFNYKNVEITANAVQPEPEPEPEPEPDPEVPVIDGTAMPAGTEKIAGNAKQYRQAFVGLPTEFAEGTSVTVEMDIYITGTYDQYVQGIYWVDTVWTTAGGELNGVTKIVDYATMNANAGKWIHVTFEATVRDFDVLRLNDREYATVDTSAYGTAVYLAVNSFTSAESFNYKNVTITSNVVEPEPEVPVIDGTAMPTGTQKTNPDKYYQSVFGFATDLPVGTLVKVDVDVYVTGTIDSYSYISWISSTYSDNAINVESKIATYDTMNASAGRWMHVEFYAFVRDFDLLRRDASYPTMDVSSVGTGVFVMASNFTSEATFNYKNVEITAEESVVGKATPAGTKKTNNADSYRQAFVGLPTDTLGAGTKVTVEMEIFVTGSYDAYSYISWVDTLWSASTGDVNNAPKIVTNDTIKASAGEWIKVKFEAVVRDFDVLRLNTAYPSMDVSSYGNAVYLVAYNFKSAESFNYRNVSIVVDDPGVAVPDGMKKSNGYYQAFVGLSTDLAVGTSVKVTMEIYVTGTYDQYTDGVKWVDTVWTAEGGEVNSAPTVVDNATIVANEGKWITVTFDAVVRNFSVLRVDSSFSTMDVSSYGNAIYLMAKNFKSAASFNYRNVVITEA